MTMTGVNMPDETITTGDTSAAGDMLDLVDRLSLRARDLEFGAAGFARAFSQAFTRGIADGKRFEDVLKSLALRLSDITLQAALRPLTRGLAGGLQQLFGGLFGGDAGGSGGGPANLVARLGAVKPFAAGGVIAAPTYFPLNSGGLGLAGEAGPEAILPLARGPDGRLGVGAAGAGTQVTINIATPDAESFRRSEVYLTGQIALAVARGQRGL
jgi:phage-related minor tail protein